MEAVPTLIPGVGQLGFVAAEQLVQVGVTLEPFAGIAFASGEGTHSRLGFVGGAPGSQALPAEAKADPLVVERAVVDKSLCLRSQGPKTGH